MMFLIIEVQGEQRSLCQVGPVISLGNYLLVTFLAFASELTRVVNSHEHVNFKEPVAPVDDVNLSNYLMQFSIK